MFAFPPLQPLSYLQSKLHNCLEIMTDNQKLMSKACAFLSGEFTARHFLRQKFLPISKKSLYLMWQIVICSFQVPFCSLEDGSISVCLNEFY